VFPLLPLGPASQNQGYYVGKFVQVLAGVVNVGGLGGLGELGGGDVPDLIPVPRLSR
jgi:hypothetical protein